MENTESQYPLSQQQLRLWLECQSGAGTTAYRMPSAALLSGPVDLEKLRQAVNAVINRHALLRCSFHEAQGRVFQKIDQRPTLAVSQAGFRASEKAALQDFIDAWLQQALDICHGPLLRAEVVQLADSDTCRYLLLLDIHHLLTDGWSNRLLLQEIMTAYRLGHLPTDYGSDYLDYIDWQGRQLEQGLLTGQGHFWQNELARVEALALGDMPAGSTGSTRTLALPAFNDSAMQQRAREWQVTPFAIYMAAWQLLLHKLGGQQTIAVATPMANRQQQAFLHTPGLFAQALPVVADFSRNITLQALVCETHTRLQMANANSEVSIGSIISNMARTGSNPDALFGAAISYDAAALQPAMHLDGITAELLPLPAMVAKFPLTLAINPALASPMIVEYDSARFSAGFIERLGNYLMRTLQAILDEPQQPLRSYCLLTADEQLAMLGLGQCTDNDINRIGSSNHTQHPLPEPASLPALITQQCRKTPAAIATSCEDYRFTYDEVDQLSDRLANHVVQLYGTGGIIGISLPRSALVTVALLGILKSGNAWLPLDAGFPPERLQQIISEAKPAGIITDSNSLPIFSRLAPCLAVDDPAWQAAADNSPVIPAHSLFNLVYTSGSTGRPKGVRVTRQGIVNRLLWMQAQYPLGPDDVILQKTPLTFDVSVWELFWPLLAGARLHYARPDGHRDAHYLHTVISEQGITTLHFVPSLLNVFLDNPGPLPALRRVFCSGEALPARTASRFRQAFPAVALNNLYGPTEAAVDVSHFDTSTPYTGTTTPLGKPVWNTQLHILDDTLRPLPPGCSGELYIGGIGLAEGYHENSALTQERFIDNPWYLDGHPSARLYKTGDLARYLPDGNLEFLGRNDFQLKLRGLRIEAGDIEQHALALPGMRHAAALLHNDQLALYYSGTNILTPGKWRDELAQHLPEWMIPNLFIHVNEWPFTTSGKTDRKALLAIALPGTGIAAATSRTEQQLQAIWEALLERPVGTDTGFFAAGGHSLLATRLVAAISREFGIHVQFRDIFLHDSIAAMAAHIDSLPRTPADTISPAPAAAAYPASWQQQRLYLFQQLNPHSTAYHMPAAFELHGAVDAGRLQQAWQTLLQRHAVLRTRYGLDGDRLVQKPLASPGWQMELRDIAGEPVDIATMVSAFNAQPFDLDNELPLRVTLYRLADTRYLLCVCLHHIAGDALTLGILARELAALYSRPDEALPELPLLYTDFACWQHQKDNHRDLQAWQAMLQGVPELLAIPHDRPRPAEQVYTGAQWQTPVPSALADRLYAFCREQGLTPFMLLLSCLQLFLGRLARQDDVCIGVPVHGREQPDLQGLAGCFINSLVMRARFDDNPGIGEFLQRQKAVILEAFAHQQAPVEQVLEQVLGRAGLVRPRAYSPVVQVGFNFLHDTGLDDSTRLEQLALALPGIRVIPVQAQTTTSKYDMTWIFYQQSNGLQLSVEFNTALFDGTTITRWAGHFFTLLDEALQQTDTPVPLLACVSETETRALLQQRYNDIEHYYPLTVTQRDIWLDSVFFPDRRHNQLGFLTHSTTALDMGLWHEVLHDLYNHADSLRARIISTSHPLLEVAWQVIPPAGELPASCFRFFDHGNRPLDDDARQQAIDSALFAPWPETEPLWRVHIHAFAGQHYLFILAAHHALFDGVSIQMLGRMIKGNYQHRLEGTPLDYPANNYADYVQQQRRRADTAASIHAWQAQATGLQPYLDFRPLLHDQPDGFHSIQHTLGSDDWQQLQQLCRQWRTSAPLFFKAVFALAIRAWHRLEGDFAFTEVVLGRDKAFYTTQGLFFEQQPNIIAANACTPEATLAEFLAWLRDYRKQLVAITPLSWRLQQRLLPNPVPYLFNFYIMESATPFLGKQERIEHLMPEMDHAVNCIAKVIDDCLHLQLMHNRTELDGDGFMAVMLHIIRQCLQGKTQLADLLPPLPESSAPRCLPAQPALPAQTHTVARAAASTRAARPATALEQQLLALWQDVLGRDDIGIDDNFFELGGHSLHAMRIASRLREAYTFDLPLDGIFHQPTVAALALYLQSAATRSHSSTLPPLGRHGGSLYPLSPAQMRLWFMARLGQANAVYNMPVALQLDGPLDQAALQQAITTLLERQLALRSVIDNRSAMPQWRILPASAFTLETVDIAADAIDDLIRQEAARPFAVQDEPLLRLTLALVQPQQHVLLLTLHHLVADAVSMGILARELAALYEACRHGQANPLPPLRFSYADYAHWHQGLLDSEPLQHQLDYWRTELAGAPELLGLPIDHPRPPEQTFRGASLAFDIPAYITAALRPLAREQGLTVFMLLLASYQLLLARTCRQHDVCIGIPRDGRVLRELEPLAGFFVNALVIRQRVDTGDTLPHWLGRVRDKVLQAMANDLVPAERVLQALQLQRQLQYTPIVQAAFNYLSVAGDTAIPDMGGLKVTPLSVPVTSAKFELLLTVADAGDHLAATFEYNSDLFDATTIVTLREQWLVLLQQLAANPGARLGHFLPQDMSGLPVGCLRGDTALDDVDFLQAIARQVQQQPEAIALRCGTEQISYAALQQQADSIAQQLAAIGLRPGDRVALCLGKRLALVPAILGVVQAGCCYVPIDTSYPPKRLAMLLEDCAPAAVINDANLHTGDWRYSTDSPAGDPRLLYIIYTSGSTGLPKGAGVYRHSENNLLAWYAREFAFHRNDRHLVISSPGFDLTQKNLLAPLCSGGCIVFPGSGPYDPRVLLHTLEQYGITRLNCAPSAFYPLLDEAARQGFRPLHSLQTLLLGGEPVYLKRLARWIGSDTFGCTLVNMYGPTECTDISTFHTLAPTDARKLVANGQADGWQFPLGQPAAGVALHLLDEQLQPVSTGQAGELCIAGIAVGAGYWQQPALTARQFVPNPFSTGEADATLYRTGDFACMTPDDGLLHYLGRRDFQLKLHGVRIEPGEIEQALRGIPAIDDARVLVDGERLLGFVLCTDNQPAETLREWRETLRQRLPGWMVPAQLIPVATWPLTPHGKVDRQALLALPRPAGPTPVAPRTPLEHTIAQEWQAVLGGWPPGIHDNFFDVGGDSLAALRLLAALETRLARPLPVATLFGAQTIAQLAQALAVETTTAATVLTLQAAGEQTPVFAIHALEPLLLAYRPLAKALGHDQPFHAIAAASALHADHTCDSLDALFGHLADTIRRQQPHGPYRIIGHSIGGIFALGIARRLQDAGERVAFVALLDTYLPRDFTLPADDSDIVSGLQQLHGSRLPAGSAEQQVATIRQLGQLLHGYQPAPLDSTALLLFTPDQTAARALAFNLVQRRHTRTRGFETLGAVQVITVPGNHVSMLDVDANSVIIKTLASTMDNTAHHV